MALIRFQCPACQAPLRLENRALFVGRPFECPDCTAKLSLEASGAEGVTARLLGLAQPIKSSPQLELRRAQWLTFGTMLVTRLQRQPALAGWLVAGLFLSGLWWAIGHDTHRSSNARNERKESVVDEPSSPASGQETAFLVKTTTEASGDPVTVATTTPDLEPTLIAENRDSTEPQTTTLPLPPAPAPPEPLKSPDIDVPPEPPSPPTKPFREVIDSRMNQKLARFDQLKPVPFVKMLDIMEDLLAAPIVWNLETVDDTQLQKPVTLSQRQTTVGEVFDALLQQVDLTYRLDGERIQLEPRAANP